MTSEKSALSLVDVLISAGALVFIVWCGLAVNENSSDPMSCTTQIPPAAVQSSCVGP